MLNCPLELMIISASIAIVHGFVLNGESPCPAPAPCQCDRSIHCERRHLISVPTAVTTSTGVTDSENVFYALYLSGNNISRIPKDAFKRYQVSRIDLSHNPVSLLDPEVFTGLEEILLELDLENTSVVLLPDSVRRLHRLRRLNIRNNSLKHLPSNIMAGIGGSLISTTRGGSIEATVSRLMRNEKWLEVLGSIRSKRWRQAETSLKPRNTK
ncbi:leucine-rich repeat-containing G-protein coupled receptor 4 [Plakobranchus ocellatus]|uniref:Leucine-rich repeat-containing G-protein coupled receptor 4 n=1 Tax=Plakobranchus ocellatus TaxID=259542 RepID=A0AAV4CYM3_9GAST|nr:leucine-rich repeat-containing G-protein coupled receptor 4 [Plakobranchus ocellatus]